MSWSSALHAGGKQLELQLQPRLRSTPPSLRPGGGTTASGPQEAEAEVNQVECLVCRVTAGKFEGGLLSAERDV